MFQHVLAPFSSRVLCFPQEHDDEDEDEDEGTVVYENTGEPSASVRLH